MKIAISTESAADLGAGLLKEYGIFSIPFTVTLGNKDGLDGDITPKQIFDYVKTTGDLPKTSAINEEQFREHFTKLLKDHDAVIHVSISHGFSVTHEKASNVAKTMKGVYAIDSLSLSSGIGLCAIYSAQLAKQGKPAEEIVKLVEKRVSKVQASFVIDKLNFLHKGGRCSGLARLSAMLLKIKPQIFLSEGKMNVGKKYFGKIGNCVEKYCEDKLAEHKPCLEYGFITYSTATPDMIEAARKAMKDAGFKTVYETTAGATITSHCGENTLGILYFNE